MRTIRRGVFETNSSSMHSITISGKDNYTRKIGVDGVINATCDEFGWGEDTFYDSHTKLSYVLTRIGQVENCNNLDELRQSRYFNLLKEMIKEYSGEVLEVICVGDMYDDLGYIDHQSSDTLEEEGLWVDDETQWKFNMMDFIYNSKYVLNIDNDNH